MRDFQPRERPGEETQRALDEARATGEALAANVGSVVRGKEPEIMLILTALAAGGHVLLEDVPGTAKTVLARALGGSIEGAEAGRIQCTPDLQPIDVSGISIYDQRKKDFVFRPGPVFTNILLVDEVNRAMPKTQSALLEAMAEGQVTVDGQTRRLPSLFLVIATENPVEHAGTFPLPEAQLDRFFLRTALGYPAPEEEFAILEAQLHHHPLADLAPVVTVAAVLGLQKAVAEVFIAPSLRRWIVSLVGATRETEMCRMGASMRGTIALDKAVRAYALLSGRHYVIPSDIEQLFHSVIEHRVIYRPSVQAREKSLWEVCQELAPRPGR